MKKPLIYFALIILSALPAVAADTNDWGAATNNVQMSISVRGGPNVIKRGQHVQLLIRFRNLSTNGMVWGPHGEGSKYDYSFIVIAPSGRELPVKTNKNTLVS